MTIQVRRWVAALAAVFLGAAPGLAQFAQPPAPPTEARPPAGADLPAPTATMHQPPEPPGKLPPTGPLHAPSEHPIADLTPPEFAGHPVTTVCDGCRPCAHPAAFLFPA